VKDAQQGLPLFPSCGEAAWRSHGVSDGSFSPGLFFFVLSSSRDTFGRNFVSLYFFRFSRSQLKLPSKGLKRFRLVCFWLPFFFISSPLDCFKRKVEDRYPTLFYLISFRLGDCVIPRGRCDPSAVLRFDTVPRSTSSNDRNVLKTRQPCRFFPFLPSSLSAGRDGYPARARFPFYWTICSGLKPFSPFLI